MKFDIPPMGSNQNYTRSYYLNGRDYIISGSCEENVVRVCCAQTGRRLRDLAVEVNIMFEPLKFMVKWLQPFFGCPEQISCEG